MQSLCILILIGIGITHGLIYNNLKKAFQNYLESLESNEENVRYRADNDIDAVNAKLKADVIRRVRTNEELLNYGGDIPSSKLPADPFMVKEHFHIDPVLNHVKRRTQNQQEYIIVPTDSDGSTSTSREEREWREEFNEKWLVKKIDAINSTEPFRETMNMVAAKPWGVPCGDPYQHDMPWGTCTTVIECDAEYRIYLGDATCGRTNYVCCGLQLVDYDLYQGFDVSFEDTSHSTDSEEKRKKEKGSKERRKRKRRRATKLHKRERRLRLTRMKRKIRKIVHQLRKILNRSFRNSSDHRTQRIKLLQKYVKKLKAKYKEERKTVMDIHHVDIDRIDTELEKKLYEIKNLNMDFLTNGTFRNIIVNHTITRTGARMLAEAYPELTEYLPAKWLRRAGGGEADKGENGDYDLEYGLLYY